MSQSRKHRGRETEHLVARWFAANGWPYALPTGAGASGRDITGMPGLACEVKARAAFEPRANLRQAVRNAGADLPFVVLRCNGQGQASMEEWPMMFTLGGGTRLLRLAGYGDTLEVTS